MKQTDKNANKYFLDKLNKLKSNHQQKFMASLVPSIDKEKILGVKNPDIRKLAKDSFKKEQDLCLKYIKVLPHKYLEEYVLHTSILEQIKDYGLFLKETERVLPYIDNWATCDSYSPKIVEKHLKDFYKYIIKWIKSKSTYTIRFGIKMFMSFYLDRAHYNNEKDFKYDDIVKKTTDLISKIRYKSKTKYEKEDAFNCPDKYYVDMMIAWFFATFLAKDYDMALPYIKNKKLEMWTHNKTIQKACESFRVSNLHKNELKGLKNIINL